MNLWDRASPTWSRLVWRLLRFCGIDLTQDEARLHRYADSNPAAALVPEDKGTATTIKDLVKDLYKQERDRREALDKKVSWLLTLSGILIPLSVNLIITGAGQLPRCFHFLALLLVTIPLLLTAVLLLEYLAVGNFSQPSIDEPLLRADEAERERIVLKSYLDATCRLSTVSPELLCQRRFGLDCRSLYKPVHYANCIRRAMAQRAIHGGYS